jgi:Uma2 family endonuclease
MSSTAPRLATFEDLLALSEDRATEVLAGELVEQAAPLPEHGRAQRALGRLIGGPYDDDDGKGGPGGWWILMEVDIELGPHDVVRPDLVGYRRQRLPAPWGVRPLRVVPDWVCEVLSPSNERHDRVVKSELYARAGIPFYWILQPTERVLEAFSLEGPRWTKLGAWSDGAAVRIAPFEEIELDVGQLFPPQA